MQSHQVLTEDRVLLDRAFAHAFDEWFFCAFFPVVLEDRDADRLGWTTIASARDRRMTWSFYWTVSKTELALWPRSEIHVREVDLDVIAANIDGGMFGVDPWEELALRFLSLLVDEAGRQS